MPDSRLQAAAEQAAADAAGARQPVGTVDMGDEVESKAAPAPKPGGKAPASAFASAFASAPAVAPAVAAAPEPAGPAVVKKRWRSGGSRPKPVGAGGGKKKSKRR